jgi:ATP-binding cassette subfamily F protein 3
MRALLASLLFQRPDLLLLDEPTNHLDMPSVAWLSGFLRQYDQAFVLISHDREFLNEQISRVVSFEPEGIRSYNGNYDQYRRQREEELEILEARAKNLERERQQAQRFIDRFRAKASKASQVQSRIKQLEKMETVELPERRSSIRFRFPPTERIGRIAIRGEGLVKAYGEHVVLGGVDVQVERGDRIAIIGANGAGKTTLLRILGGEMTPDQGEVHYGNRVKLGYYAQHHAEALPRNATVYDAVVKRCPDEDRTRTRAALGAMHMRDDDVEKPVRVLSGGERARVALAQMLVDPGNVLLMDEPTNHLDLDSSERIAEALDTFDGTLVFVSHNRRFLRGLANKIWHVDSKGVEVYPGTLDEYMHSIRQDLQQDAPPETRAATARAADGAQGQAAETETASRSRDEIKARKRREAELRAERKRRLEPLRKRVRELEARIAELEKAQSERAELLSDPALYEDPERRDRVLAEHGKAAEEIESLTAQWMESQQELEEAEGALQQE